MQIRTLDGLRGYAALFVLFAHLPFKAEYLPDFMLTFLNKFHLGYFGVETFFVLSGFLITRILIKEKKADKFSFKRFYIKRALRIFPIFYLAIIVFGFLIDWKNLGYVASYTSNYYFAFDQAPNAFRHSWSLAVEEQYYLLWPFLLYFFTLKNSKLLIKYLIPIVVLLSSYIIVKNFDYQEANGLIYRGFQSKILSLAIGSYFAFIEPKLKGMNLKLVLALLLLFIGAMTLIINIELVGLSNEIPIAFIYLFLYSTCATCFFLVVFALENKHGIFNFLFTNKTITFFGKISYGLYLYHLPIFFYFGISHMDYGAKFELTNFILAIALMFVVPILSYFLVEKPILRLKNKIH